MINNEEIKAAHDELGGFQSQLYEKLKGIKVKYDPIKNSDIHESIEALYGPQDISSPSYGYITFDMLLECMQVIKLSGGDKADSILSRFG